MRRNRVRFLPLAAVAALLGVMLTAPAAHGDEVALDPAVASAIEHALAALDDEDFSTRSAAVESLERFSNDPALTGFLSDRFARVLRAPDVSVEVRTRLESLAKGLPAGSVQESPVDFDAAGVARLLEKLQSDSSAARESARGKLKRMLAHAQWIAPLWGELKQRACDGALSAAARRELEPLLDSARAAWLAADPAAVPLPPVTREQIEAWIDLLAHADETESLDRFRRRFAERELLDGMARDEVQPLVSDALARRIAAAPDAASRTTLQQIADYARPAMAAEVWLHELGNWEHRQHITVQYLIVGVPQFAETAQYATHFDRIDEDTAHCVSGNSLKPGDYPVRVAIPHPDPTMERMFYLTNLPTARRRLAYEYQVQRDEGERLCEISRRTLDYFIEHDLALGETQVLLLAQLDPHVTSQAIGKYLRTVADRRIVTTISELNAQPTVHRAICQMMVRVGTREAVPALEELARSGRVDPSDDAMFHIGWIAALAIAQRDPWPGVDDWLASLIDLKTTLVTSGDARPDVGASAAALLVDRHGASTRPFGLVTAGEAATERLRFIGYRFVSDRHREDVKRWWQKERAAAAERATP